MRSSALICTFALSSFGSVIATAIKGGSSPEDSLAAPSRFEHVVRDGSTLHPRGSSNSSDASPDNQTPAFDSVNATSTDESKASSESDTVFADAVYAVKDVYEGSTFFSGFNYQAISDPTHGNVEYVSQSVANSAGLTYLDNGVAVIKVDDTTTLASGGLRKSVRLESKNTYTRGLFILDAEAMPYGCGVWPAFWMYNTNWPYGGEIDVVEGVNLQTQNQYTLHTTSGCTLDTSFHAAKRRRNGHAGVTPRHSFPQKRDTYTFTGNVLTTNCDANVNSNSGCGIQDPSTSTFGANFNSHSGGVWATRFESDGIAIWYFPRGSVPSDITNRAPNPSTWGSPKAFWASTTCPISTYFKAQTITINTTLCGDWAGSVYSTSGCPGTCADRVANPANFSTAKWRIKSLVVYQ